MPCYFLYQRIKKLLEQFNFITQNEIENELLKENSDEELHEMSEDDLYALILAIYKKLIKKKMRKEANLLYI